LPLALEQAGVFAPTWWLGGDGLVTHSTVIETHRSFDMAGLIFGQTAIGIVVALYTASFARTTRAAQRRAHRQAWHLEQMLPRGMSKLR